MNAKEHYERHLARIYAWMAGDFKTKQAEYLAFLQEHNIMPQQNGVALDLGCGHGIQSTALALSGFKVTAVDFNRLLLNELEENSKNLPVFVVQDEIENINRFAALQPELITCWGDTLTHLSDSDTAEKFINDCCRILSPGGKLVLSFRDYTLELKGTARFIPVKSDDQRILTCLLEYGPGTVTVTDLLYEKTGKGWEQSASAYPKLRLAPATVLRWLDHNRMQTIFAGKVNRMETLIMLKK